jgi:acyl carrier protein
MQATPRKEQVLLAVQAAIDEMNLDLPEGGQLDTSLDTELFGRLGRLDSLGLVNLVVAAESAVLAQFDCVVTLANEKAMSRKSSPFRTVGSLVDYIDELLKEKPSDAS